MSDGKADTAARKPEDPTLLAYRLWFEHARKCDHCKRVHKASDGCDDGRALWGTYRLACIALPERKREPS